MDPRAEHGRRWHRWLSWWRGLPAARVRLWAVLGIHLAAFGALYVLMMGLTQRAASEAAATAARFQLDEAVRRMPFQWIGTTPHMLTHVLAAQKGMALRLYRSDASPVGLPDLTSDPWETEEVRRFLAGRDLSDSWVVDEDGGQWVHGVVRITADQRCGPCHASGETLGAATMRIDFTRPLAEIRDGLRGRMGLLLGGWIVVLGMTTMAVQRTVARAGVRLRADLDAADAGDGVPPPPVSLDPVTAEVHRNLREVLRHHRERESQLVSRLAHVDQLASLGQLAAGLAHEIKNPLAGIQGVLEVLREEADSETNERLYGEMLDELARVNGILRRLLESARPAPPRLARTDVARLLAETADLLRPALQRRGVELRVETAEHLPAARVDAAQLRQVIVNLVHNASEAMPETGGHVVVRASGLDADGTLAITVEDDGCGIAPENVVNVFQPFFTTKFAGTGLGLAISKGLVEQHGGRIEVSSEPGRGTSFVILLPRRDADEVAKVAGDGEPSGAESEESPAWR